MTGFDDNGRPVLIVGFKYPDDGAPAPAERDGRAGELASAVQGALSIILTGHRDAIAVRAAALAHLLGTPGFATQSEAARQVRAKPAAVNRALAKLRRALGKLAEARRASIHIEESRALARNSE